MLRRSEGGPSPTAGGAVRFGAITLDPRARAVVVGGQDAGLTAKEFDLLCFLAQHPGEVFTRAQLMGQVCDYTYAGDASTVTVHIRRLREKIEPDPVRPRYIKTVWGVGYKFEA